MTVEQADSITQQLDDRVRIFQPCFKRRTTFRHFLFYLLGLMAALPRKSVEPIALAAGTAVRTMQEFLSHFKWGHAHMDRLLRRRVADKFPDGGIAIVDATGHVKRGDKTPGVQRQCCGEVGKVENCGVAQHLLFCTDDADNPFRCMLACDLYLSEEWADDMARRAEAHIPEQVQYRPKWLIAIDQLRAAVADGVKLDCVIADAEYGSCAPFWLKLDAAGLAGVADAARSVRMWVKQPRYRSVQAGHAPRRAEDLVARSKTFTRQEWTRYKLKDATRGTRVWECKWARVHLIEPSDDRRPAQPTEREYWLVAMRAEGSEAGFDVALSWYYGVPACAVLTAM